MYQHQKNTKAIEIDKSQKMTGGLKLVEKIWSRSNSSGIYESILNGKGTSEKGKISNIEVEKAAFHKMEVLLSKSLKLDQEKRLGKTLVWSVWRLVSYGSKTWTLKQGDIRRMECSEMWFWRMERVSWIDRITSKEVPVRVGESRCLIETVWKRPHL